MRKVKIGMIGAGSHANNVHYPSISSLEEAEIIAICDINRERLKATADKYRISNRYLDYREMLDRHELDAIYIIMPPHILYDIALDCLKDGINIFIEKPPGITRNQTESLAWFAEKYRCKTMVGFNRRFVPLLRKVKGMVESRGPINQCVSSFYKNIFSEDPPYYSGAIDVLTSDVIHSVDALRWMAGDEPKEVHSSVRKVFLRYDNSFNALIEFRNGVVGILMSNWTAGARVHTFEMHGKGISAFVNPDDRALICVDGQTKARIISTFEAAGGRAEFYAYYGFLDENKHFLQCILEDKEPETCFRDAVKTMRLVEMIRGTSY